MIDTISNRGNGSMSNLVTALGARKSGSGYIARCPVHQDNEPSLSLSVSRAGVLLLKCFAGCDYKSIIEALSTKGFDMGQRKPWLFPIAALEPDQRKSEAIMRWWNEGRTIEAGDPVSLYLKNRGIRLTEFPVSLRFHPSAGYWHQCEKTGAYEKIGEYPAMLARVTSKDGELISVHRTYLTDRGTKAEVPQPKKLMSPALPGASRSGAIRLFNESKLLAVAEGIETALAVHSAKGWAVWSTISAGGMASLVVPDHVEEVIICADNDASGSGEKAANTLAQRLHGAGKRVRIAMPPGPITGKSVDWADVLGVQES